MWHGFSWVLLGVLILPTVLPAQPSRYELGQRMIAFEKAWDTQQDAAGRKRAALQAAQAVQKFFSLNLPAAGQAMDQGRFLLASEELPALEVRWAESLFPHPAKRIFDPAEGEIPLEIRAFYATREMGKDFPVPAKASLILRLGSATQEFPLTKLPTKVTFSLKGVAKDRDQDLKLIAEVHVAGKKLATQQIGVSLIGNAAARLAALKEGHSKEKTIETATLASLSTLLNRLAEDSQEETDYPAARLLAEAERLKKGLPCYTPKHPGEFWLTIPVGTSRTAAVRLFVPEKLDKPRPLLVAMHGAGGSENLFFDGYGDGITRKLCQERGWIMVATRAGFGGSPPVAEVIAELAKVYPIDPARIYLVGHSMGAAMAVGVAQSSPELFAGVATLGGSGRISKLESIRSVPFFVGVGKQDFALRGARTLVEALKKGGIETVQGKEYDDIEHLLIVREAMPEVMKFFDSRFRK